MSVINLILNILKSCNAENGNGSFCSNVLAVFIHCGILNELIASLKISSNVVKQKSLELIEKILHMANLLLPSSISMKIQALPSLFIASTNFKNKCERHEATAALDFIDRIHSKNCKSRKLFDSVEVELNKSATDLVKSKLVLQYDSTIYKQLLTEWPQGPVE